MIPPGRLDRGRFRQRYAARVVIFTAVFSLFGAGPALFGGAFSHAADVAEKIPVSVSIHPVALLVARVGGERVEVSTLLPAGASPHGFEPSPRQVRSLAGADLVVTVGGGLDPWARQAIHALQHNPPHLVLARSAGIPDAQGHSHGDEDETAPGFHGEGGTNDPHLWLDPILVRDVIVPDIVAALSRLMPDASPVFHRRGAAFQAQLTELDGEIAARLAPYADRPFVAFHGSWDRFSRHYGLHPVGVVMPFPGREPSARQMAQVLEAGGQGGAAVLIEPQFNPRIARTLAEQLGGKLVLVDPMGHPDKPYGNDYISLMRFNGQAFEEALKP